MYYTVKHNFSGDLDDEVSRLLTEGWNLHGSPFYAGAYCQAMYRLIKKEYINCGPR